MEKPACVDVCPTKALELVDIERIDALLSEKRRKTSGETKVSGIEALTILDLGR